MRVDFQDEWSSVSCSTRYRLLLLQLLREPLHLVLQLFFLALVFARLVIQQFRNCFELLDGNATSAGRKPQGAVPKPWFFFSTSLARSGVIGGLLGIRPLVK